MASRFGVGTVTSSSKKPETFEEMEDSPEKENIEQSVPTEPAPQGGLLWRFSAGAVSGAYNLASGAASYGVNGTKWALNKGVEVGSSAVTMSKDLTVATVSKTAEAGSAIIHKVPLPALVKGKDKKE